jgi:hypothetical protein
VPWVIELNGGRMKLKFSKAPDNSFSKLRTNLVITSSHFGGLPVRRRF